MSWLNLLSTLRKFPFLGIYVVMFTDVLQTFLKFSLIILLFIVAFSLGFHALIGEQVKASNMLDEIMCFSIESNNTYNQQTSINWNILFRTLSYAIITPWWKQQWWWLENLNMMQYFLSTTLTTTPDECCPTNRWPFYSFLHLWL